MENSDNTGPAGKTILIVDDEFGVLEVLEFILRDAGFKVVTALNGQDALSRLKEVMPDLIIVDYMMPILDGLGVINAVRSDDGLRNVPIILVSALPEQNVRERCAGYDSFLRKPYKTEQLMDQISSLLARTESDGS